MKDYESYQIKLTGAGETPLSELMLQYLLKLADSEARRPPDSEPENAVTRREPT